MVAMASVLLSTFRFQLARPGAVAGIRESSPDLLRRESRIWQDPAELLPADALRTVSSQEKNLQSLTRGCFAPVAQQPILGALATLVGGSGLITLLEQMASR
jgi:hypothetical protein